MTLKTIRNFVLKISRSLRTQVFREMLSTFFTEEVEINETMVYKEKKDHPFERGYRTQFWFIGIKSRIVKLCHISSHVEKWRDLLRIILKYVMIGGGNIPERSAERYIQKGREP